MSGGRVESSGAFRLERAVDDTATTIGRRSSVLRTAVSHTRPIPVIEATGPQPE